MAGVSTTAALLIGGGAFAASSSIMGANQQAKAMEQQANYNAEIYGQQAEMVKQKKKIADQQFLRNAANARSTIISRTAGKGLNLGGSPLAILIDNESQMQFDKAIQDYNFDVETNYAKSGQTNTIEQGRVNSRATRYAGYTNAFSTMLNTGAQIGMLNMYKPGKI